MSTSMHRLLAAGLVALAAAAPWAWAADPAPAPAVATAVAPAAAASAPAAAEAASAPASLDNRIQDVKGDVIRLNRDLLVLEEELLLFHPWEALLKDGAISEPMCCTAITTTAMMNDAITQYSMAVTPRRLARRGRGSLAADWPVAP